MEFLYLSYYTKIGLITESPRTVVQKEFSVKGLLFSFLLLSSMNAFAARNISVHIDGQTYFCSGNATPTNPPDCTESCQKYKTWGDQACLFQTRCEYQNNCVTQVTCERFKDWGDHACINEKRETRCNQD
jgi:hypothetical protein